MSSAINGLGSIPSSKNGNGKPKGGDPLPMRGGTEAAAEQAVYNTIISRAELISRTMDPMRDIDRECGFSKFQLHPNEYQDWFDRDPVAARVVEAIVNQSWRVQPLVFESKDTDEITEYEEVWDGLSKQLNGGEESFHQDEKGSLVYHYLKELSIKARIGRFAIMVIGIDDGLPLDQPAKMKPGKVRHNLTFLRTFSDAEVQISSLEADTNSPRWGKPTYYNVMFGVPTVGYGSSIITETKRVHWTRVHHLTPEGPGGNAVLAIPPLFNVQNEILSAKKVRSAGPEAYWKNCFTGLAFKTQAGVNKIDTESLKTMAERYGWGLQKFMAVAGVDIDQLSPTVVDPGPHHEMCIEAICIKIEMPVRIFKGSERGELSSTQDQDDWNAKVASRENGYETPRNIVPFANRLIHLGVLPKPVGFTVEWPDLTARTEGDKMAVALQKVEILNKYTAGNPPSIMAPLDLYTRVLGESEEDAETILDNADEHAEEVEAEQMAKQQEMADLGLDVDGNPLPPPPAPPGQQPQGQPGPPGQGPPKSTKDDDDDEEGGGKTTNTFCPTGPGGGIDPTCGPGGQKRGSGATGSGAPSEGIGQLISKISQPDGGFTYSPVTNQSPTTGFALSPYPERSFAVPAKDLKMADIVDYAVKNKDLLSSPEHFMGGWHDPASGKVFLDVSIVTQDRAKATKLAMDKDQIAFFDLGKMESVTVNPKATSGGAANARQQDTRVVPDTRGSNSGANPGPVQEVNREGANGGGVGGGPGAPQGDPDLTSNDFCPTGPGGGIDPTCSPGGGKRAVNPNYKQDQEKFKELKKRWAEVNNELLYSIDRPDSPEAKGKLNELEDICKQMHKLEADPGGLEGIGFPGGAKDVLIIGGGPGGLTAGVMGGTEGLDTMIIEAQEKVGGQAKFSSRIENYPGFPIGASGKQLAENMEHQAARVGAQIKTGTRVEGMAYDEKTGLKTVRLSTGEIIEARTVIIAAGVEFKKVDFPGSDSDRILYGDSETLTNKGEGKPVVVVGGSNGASQAALGAARKSSQVTLISRSPIEKSMSDYQVNALRNQGKIQVIEGDQIVEFKPDQKVAVTREGRQVPAEYIGMFVGSSPNLSWVPPDLGVKDGKISVNSDLETNIPGVFAVGDNRVGGIQRVGGAVGDGQMAVKNVFKYFDRERAKLKEQAEKERGSETTTTNMKPEGKKREQLEDQWDDLIADAFKLDRDNPWFGQTVEPDEVPDATRAENQFCPTGPGGGIDPTCSPGGGKKGSPRGAAVDSVEKANVTWRIAAEKKATPPPPGGHNPDVESDSNGDGVTDASRVGVPAFTVPPPPPIGRLPNLTPHERAVENKFIGAYEADPDGIAKRYRQIIEKTTKPGEPPTFGTDDAKALADAWENDNLGVRSQNRATLNLALHQTANAIAKRAFVQELDTLKPGDEIMVTVGGVGAGKGYALKNVPQALEMKGRSKVVWDSAGDQNATENPWIQAEADRRGLKVNYVYVHADPRTQWAHPERGVVKRAGDPNDGRMVDAKVFADSYALGAKNHQAFYEQNRNKPNASFIFLENAGTPRILDGIPAESLKIDRKELAVFAARAVRESGAPPHVQRGGTMGLRVWGEEG